MFQKGGNTTANGRLAKVPPLLLRWACGVNERGARSLPAFFALHQFVTRENVDLVCPKDELLNRSQVEARSLE